MKQQILTRTGDFWWARVNALGDRVVCGNTSIKVLALDQPSAWWPVSEIGRSGRWIDPRTVTYMTVLSATTARRFTAAERDSYNGRNAGGTEALIAGNAFETNASGMWASWLAPNRLAIDDTLMSTDATGLHAGGPYFVTATLSAPRTFRIYSGQTFQQAFPLPARANDWSVSDQGWIGYGYYWEARALTPAGNDVDLTITPWRQESVPQIVHTPAGDTWIWTATVTPVTNRPLVLGRPFGSQTAIVLEGFPAAGLSVVFADRRFVIAGHDDRGNLQVWEVTPDERRETIAPEAVPPAPEPLPDIPFTAIEGAVVEDLLPRLQAQCTAMVGNVLWFRKSDPPDWGAWHDFDAHSIGLLADSSTGKMLSDGRVDSMYFGRDHLWFPRRLVNGWTAEYDTTFIWADGARIPAHVTLEVYVGHGRYQGVDVDVAHHYDNRSPDPKNPRRQLPDGTWVGRMAGYKEIDYLRAGGGFERWEAWQDDQNGVPRLVQWTQPYPIAAKGVFVAPPRPQPYDPIVTIQPPEKPPVSLTVQQVVDGLGALPWDLDVAALQQFAAGVWKRDRLGDDVVTGGALAYFHRYVFAAIAEQFQRLGRLPDASNAAKDAAEWRAGFDLGVQRALAAYRREIPPDPEDNANPQ